MIRRSTPTWLPCALVCALISSAGLSSEAKNPKASTRAADTNSKPADAKKGAQARMRLWKANDATAGATQISLLPESGSPLSLPVDAQGLQLTNYLPVPAGPGKFVISVNTQPPISVPVNLAAGSDSTLLVQIRGNVVHARWINDTPAAEEGGTNFSIYNLLGGNGGDMQVMLGDVMSIRLSTPGSSSTVGGLKAGVYPVTVNGTDSDGKTVRWNTETDLKKNHRSSLLIFPDSYGRIRPRLVEDPPN